MSETPSAAQPRSKRMYVLWGVALTLLIATAIFCWAVVVPVWRPATAFGKLSGPPTGT